MAKSNAKWEMFKNFLHNEIGVSKDDIREWIRESCREEAKALVEQEHGAFNIKTIIKGWVEDKGYYGEPMKKRVAKEIAEKLMDRVDIG